MPRNTFLTTLGVLVLIALVVFLGFYITGQSQEENTPGYGNNLNDDNSASPTETEDNNDKSVTSNVPVPGNDVDEMIVVNEDVSITNSGFSPATLEVAMGSTVSFTNNGSDLSWPAVDPHPVHTNLPGFDSQRPLEPGESWAYTFQTAGSYGYHDHLNSSIRGTIVVR